MKNDVKRQAKKEAYNKVLKIKEKYPEIFDLIITLVYAVGITEQQRQDAKKEIFDFLRANGHWYEYTDNDGVEEEVFEVFCIPRTIWQELESKLKEAKK